MRAALALLLGLGGWQDKSPPIPAEKPTFTLVAVRAISSVQSGIPIDCPDGVICVDTLSFAAFDQAQTLYGPDLGDTFGASIAVHMRLRYEPMLLVVASLGDRHQVIAWGRGGGSDQTACVRRVELPDGWIPEAPGLIPRSTVLGEELCASIAGIKTVLPTDPVVMPVDAISVDDLRRRRPRGHRKN